MSRQTVGVSPEWQLFVFKGPDGPDERTPAGRELPFRCILPGPGPTFIKAASRVFANPRPRRATSGPSVGGTDRRSHGEQANLSELDREHRVNSLRALDNARQYFDFGIHYMRG